MIVPLCIAFALQKTNELKPPSVILLQVIGLIPSLYVFLYLNQTEEVLPFHVGQQQRGLLPPPERLGQEAAAARQHQPMQGDPSCRRGISNCHSQLLPLPAALAAPAAAAAVHGQVGVPAVRPEVAPLLEDVGRLGVAAEVLELSRVGQLGQDGDLLSAAVLFAAAGAMTSCREQLDGIREAAGTRGPQLRTLLAAAVVIVVFRGWRGGCVGINVVKIKVLG